MLASEKDIEVLNSIYDGRKAYFGDLHNHSDSGGTSDGKCTLSRWRERMSELEMDFAAILDHRQVRHMYLPEWEDGVFIGGSEPGTTIPDSGAEVKGMHYNMLFENSAPLEKLLADFPEFAFEGGTEGHFSYPNFTVSRMRELIDYIKSHGGFFVYPHPTQIMRSDNPLDFWFADETGIEVFYYKMTDSETQENYKLWCKLLELGKRVYACAGEDGHSEPTTNALTVIYAEEKKNSAYLKYLRKGDFVCGNVGIKMCVGDTPMGGVCGFDGKNIAVSVSDFHKSVVKDGHQYKILLISEKGIENVENINPETENCFVYKAEPRMFYRVEIFDETEKLRIAIGNPVWNYKE